MVDHTAESVRSVIAGIEATDDNLTSRAGLAAVSRYIRKIGIAGMLAEHFSF